MTTDQILNLIVKQQSIIGRKKQTHLARGLWAKAWECEVQVTTLGDLRTLIVETETTQAKELTLP